MLEEPPPPEFQGLFEVVPRGDETFKHDYKHLWTEPAGSHGIVSLYQLKEGDEKKKLYAVKKRRIDGENQVDADKELKALKALSSWRKRSGQAMRHIIGLARDLEETVFKSATHVYFVLETYPNLQPLCSWQRATYANGPVREVQTTVDLIHQLLHAIEMLHTRSIDMAHRDIKPNNILVDVETLDLWLCDFSMAKSGSLMTQSPGHDLFQAPETRTGASSYTAKCDVWSAGVVWLWMLGGEKLVMEKRWRQQNGKLSFSAALNLTIRARSDANAEPLHSTIWPLLVQMFHEDPDKRPDARVLYDDPTINPLKAEISLLPRRAVVLVLGSDFHLQGEDHCETVIEYLRYCSPHLKEEARIHRLHGGKKGKNLRADELENNLTKCLDEDLLSVEFDVMIYFHSLHGYEINEGGDVAIVLNEKESFAFGPKLAGLKERVERADEWTTAIGEGTILGYLQRHPTMRGKRLIALAGNCREPATTEHRRVVQMPNNQTNGASRPTEVVELVLQYAAQSGGLALLSKGGDASWSKRLVHQDVMSPSTSLMGWLHDASKLLIDEKPQLVDTHILGEVHMLSAMRL